MPRHDEPLYDDEPPEQRAERAVNSVIKSQHVDKVTARRIVEAYLKELEEEEDIDKLAADTNLFTRRIMLEMLFMNENEKARLLRHLIWIENTRGGHSHE